MPHIPSRLIIAVTLSAMLFPFASSNGHAQAVLTASKSADLSVFGGYEYVYPAYGPDKNSGGAFGIDFTRYFHFPIKPSVEARANFNSGTFSTEHSYLFGLRALYPFHRLGPYVDFMVGPGNIHYPRNIGYVGDNSIVYNYGGGIDLGVTRSFSLKLDVQGQRWNTGEKQFTPTLGLVGLSYTLPFRPHITQGSISH